MLNKLTNRISQITLPSVYNRHVHCYLIEFDTYYVLIDCGENNDESKEFWKQFLKTLTKPITHLIVTHIHTDHCGCCHLLQRQIPLRILSSALSKIKLQKMKQNTKNFVLIESAARYGIAYPYKHKELLDEVEAYDFQIDETFGEGHTFHFDNYKLTAIATPGHAIDQYSLYAEDDKLLFASDHLIEDFSPVLIIEETFENPLQSYLNSLDKLKSLSINLSLPGHGSLIEAPVKLIETLENRHFLKLQTIHHHLQKHTYTAEELLYLLYKKDTKKASPQLMQLISYLNFLMAQNKISQDHFSLSAQ